MIVDCIADLHGYMPKLPGGDILVIAGDCTARDTFTHWENLGGWMVGLDYDFIVLVAGNHDFALNDYKEEVLELLPDNVVYLQDEYAIIRGISFYGVPWTPLFYDWAFMLPRYSEELKEKFNNIPDKVDILVTHGPPQGILDECDKGKVGCEYLREVLAEKNIKYHVFGHIHEEQGKEEVFENTRCYNVSFCDGRYKPKGSHRRIIL